MKKNSIADRLRKIVSKELKVRIEKVTDESLLVEDLGADSLNTIGLVMDFEDEFGVKISDEKVMEVSTVGQAIAGVASLIKQKGGESDGN